MNHPHSIAEALELYGWHDGRHQIPDTEAITISTAAILAHTQGPMIGPESQKSPEVQNALQAILDTAPVIPAEMIQEDPDPESFLGLPLQARVDGLNKHVSPHEAALWAQRADSLITLGTQAF